MPRARRSITSLNPGYPFDEKSTTCPSAEAGGNVGFWTRSTGAGWRAGRHPERHRPHHRQREARQEREHAHGQHERRGGHRDDRSRRRPAPAAAGALARDRAGREVAGERPRRRPQPRTGRDGPRAAADHRYDVDSARAPPTAIIVVLDTIEKDRSRRRGHVEGVQDLHPQEQRGERRASGVGRGHVADLPEEPGGGDEQAERERDLDRRRSGSTGAGTTPGTRPAPARARAARCGRSGRLARPPRAARPRPPAPPRSASRRVLGSAFAPLSRRFTPGPPRGSRAHRSAQPVRAEPRHAPRTPVAGRPDRARDVRDRSRGRSVGPRAPGRRAMRRPRGSRAPGRRRRPTCPRRASHRRRAIRAPSRRERRSATAARASDAAPACLLAMRASCPSRPRRPAGPRLPLPSPPSTIEAAAEQHSSSASTSSRLRVDPRARDAAHAPPRARGP